ncbi:tyrosine--tRNA ligase [Pontibacter sp. BT310]|uniref:Tyrosine--tRNA ligase n=1 Tax=Pontibacter populi TaxID=890055 RepID=A0ABS6XAV8_9BACT|nr:MULTISPECIES: tyrosine--tRNA ligase [Pontibacter]MBJ6117926.1 tyrosine--tRNA ligase [Pontibacter sp. BT310]MBR0570353.1 tyrosine--tRNA ligase [Microvirga sp. STS03]MBW3364779.1 tyrosine--tRNA ligase [Pontibacter populi]
MNLIEELRWRGMLHDFMPGTEEQLASGMTTGYIGFDPTASSLHIGNLATIMLLVHLQRAGHKPVALVGGATGMIGDPSGKSAERNLLDETTLRANQEGIKAQLEKFLDFNAGANSAEIVNNYDWFKEFSFLGFLREVGKHLTVNYMMAKDSVKKRISADEEGDRAEGLSFTEFSYQLIQGYDFYHLYKNKGVRLQMGASDQWGNITTGTELIRRMDGGKAFALVGKLVTKSDGTKFGKSEGGNIWLNATLTSPYKFYQFWLNLSDEEAEKLIKVYTLLPQDEIERLTEEHKQAPHLRVLQKALAKDVTIRVHSEEDYNAAIDASEILFGKGDLETLKGLKEDILLSVFEGVPQIEVSKNTYAEAQTVSDLLSDVTGGQVFESKGEAKRMIKNGGVSVNRQKVQSPDEAVNFELLQERYLVVQKGKKNYYLITVN